MGSKRNKKRKTNYIDFDEFESDDTFVFIAGYTSGGFPYGITWEEMKEKEDDEPGNVTIMNDLPF